MRQTDVLIIGAGPAGITAALYLKRANVSFIWVEKGMPGGKLVNLAEVGNYPGLAPSDGFTLANNMLQSAYNAGAQLETLEVFEVNKDNGLFTIKTNKEDILAKAVLVATGLSNVPSIKGEKEFFGKGVSYCATCDGPLLRKKTAVIYGKGDRVLEESLYLANIVSKLFVITQEHEYEGSENLISSLKEKENVEFINDAKITSINGGDFVNSVTYIKDGEEKEIETNMIFPFSGERSAVKFLSPLKVETNKNFIVVNSEMMSNVPGLFASGDVTFKKLRQVITAASDGAVASTGIISYLNKLKKEAK